MRRISIFLAVLACGLLAAVAVTRTGTSSAQAAGTPIFASSASPLTFDFVSVGSSATKTETIKNAGTAALKLSAVQVGSRDAGDFKIVSDTCTGDTLAPGATCTVGVRFTPTASGTRVAVLKFTDNTPCHDYLWMAGSGDEAKPTLLAAAATCESSVDDALANAGTTVTNNNTVTTTTTTATRTPTVSGSSIVLPKAPTCESRRVVTIRFNAPKGKTFTQARILLHGKTIKTLKGGDIKTKVSLKGLPRGRFTLQVKATTNDGQHLSQTRHYVTCVSNK
jgi:hypothetical protein